MRGAATLPLRMKAHQEAAMTLATRLEGHPAIKRVFYPGLASHPQHGLAKAQMKNFSGMMTFQTHEAGMAVARRMVKQLEIIHYAVSLGHLRSLIYWIGTDDIEQSTFRHGPEAASRFRDYMGDGVFRLSVGIEDGDDLWADLVRCF
jgi:methionine-gamma-lyase